MVETPRRGVCTRNLHRPSTPRLRSVLTLSGAEASILTYLKRQASNGDTEVETLHTELLADSTNTTYQDLLKTERKVSPHRTPGGAYIID